MKFDSVKKSFKKWDSITNVQILGISLGIPFIYLTFIRNK